MRVQDVREARQSKEKQRSARKGRHCWHPSRHSLALASACQIASMPSLSMSIDVLPLVSSERRCSQRRARSIFEARGCRRVGGGLLLDEGAGRGAGKAALAREGVRVE